MKPILLLCLFFVSFKSLNASPAGEVALAVTLTPAGSFIARSQSLAGTITRTLGGSWTAQNLELDLNSLNSGIALRDSHMKEKYFEVAKDSKAVLIQVQGKDGEFSGDLRMHQSIKKISGKYQWNTDQLKATFVCKMSDFGIPPVSYLGVGTEDEVTVEANLSVPGESGK